MSDCLVCVVQYDGMQVALRLCLCMRIYAESCGMAGSSTLTLYIFHRLAQEPLWILKNGIWHNHTSYTLFVVHTCMIHHIHLGMLLPSQLDTMFVECDVS